MISKHCLTIFLLLLLIVVSVARVDAAPRNEIALFEYKGVVVGGTSDERFRTFRGILEDKISQLRREVQQKDTNRKAIQNFDYLRDVHVSFRSEDTFTTPQNITRWLKNQTSVLCLLRGTIVSDDNITYHAKSNFYLGELKDNFPYDEVKITLPVVSSEFSNTRDSHSLVILYALAMDAKRLGYDKNHILHILSKAKNKLEDIKRRSGGDLSDDMVALENAIHKVCLELKGCDAK